MTNRQAVETMLRTVDFLTLKQRNALRSALADAREEDIHAIGKFLAAYLKAETQEMVARQL